MMSNMEVKIEVDGVAEVNKALESGLRHGMEDAGEWFLDNGVDKARDNLMETDRIWRGTVAESFQTSVPDIRQSPSRWEGKIENEALHAHYVEHGMEPGETNPSVQDILPWVHSEAAISMIAPPTDVGDWHPDLKRAAFFYGPRAVVAAFKIKNGIEERGYPGVHFMRRAENFLESMKYPVWRGKIEQKMNEFLKLAYGAGNIPNKMKNVTSGRQSGPSI